eukprot:7339135-Prymnesium_polylepis.4
MSREPAMSITLLYGDDSVKASRSCRAAPMPPAYPQPTAPWSQPESARRHRRGAVKRSGRVSESEGQISLTVRLGSQYQRRAAGQRSLRARRWRQRRAEVPREHDQTRVCPECWRFTR